jgi:uncharacterized protein YjbI with pentapeptide repeats
MEKYRPVSEFSHQGVPLSEILKNHEKWAKQREGRRADLIGAKLGEADLSKAYLRGADLIKADLKGADLKGANLSEANLFGADLTGTKLMGANFRRANLEKANLSEANLSGTDLSEVNLKGAYLSWTKMIRSNLSEASLKEAYLRGADLTHADLSKADLTEVNLIGANLSEARLGGATLREANLTEVYLRGSDMSYAVLSGADVREGNLEKANLNSANLRNAILTSTRLVGADLTGADLSGACLDHAITSEWIIRDVRCTHIIRGDQREVVRFNPGEFEKKFAQSQKYFEIILDVSLSASTYYVGKFVTRSINHVVGSRVVDLKGMEGLTSEDTKFVFYVLDDAFFEKRKEAVEIELRVALNKFFREQALEKEQSYFGDIAEEEDNNAISRGDILPLIFTPWHMDHRAKQDELVEHYSRLGKMGESIYQIISSIFQ